MSCHNCARTTLGLFIRSFINAENAFASRRIPFKYVQPSRLISTAPRPHKSENNAAAQLKPKSDIEDITEDDTIPDQPERPAWQLHKAAIKEKLGGEAWNPRKKLSPDTMEGIRHLHSTQPTRFTTPILAEHFRVSPEAIRRILKSKWRPSDEEYEARMERWNKRGERIWTNLVEMGVKPPKKWREMGVGRATGGERPKWKSDRRNMVHVRDSVNPNIMPDEGVYIPIVDGTGKSTRIREVSLAQRL